MAYVDVKLFNSYIGSALPDLSIAMTASIAVVLCFRDMVLRSVISDFELSWVSWVLYMFFGYVKVCMFEGSVSEIHVKVYWKSGFRLKVYILTQSSHLKLCVDGDIVKFLLL